MPLAPPPEVRPPPPDRWELDEWWELDEYESDEYEDPEYDVPLYLYLGLIIPSTSKMSFTHPMMAFPEK